MHLFTKLSFISSLLATMTIPAIAGVTVSSPGNNTDVSSPFTVSADASTCSSQTVVSMAYSLDSGGDIAIVTGTVVQRQVTAGSGGHTVHVKAWGNKGAVCVTDAVVTVTAGSSAMVASGATSVSNMQTLSNWKAVHDGGTPGTSSGNSTMVGSPSRSGNTRRFSSTFTNNGGERFSLLFGDDASAHNFVYDAWVYIAAGSAVINLEMDLNQVMANDQTVIFGVQCDGWSNTWDFSVNKGSPTNPSVQWAHSGAYCNPRSWGTNAWHHVQISYARNDSGLVTYKAAVLDGKVSSINATVPSAYALGWAPVLLTNFQVDGIGASGGSVVYLDNLTLYRW